MNRATVPSTALLLPDPDWTVAGAGDDTGDGNEDILQQNASIGSVVGWQMNGITPAGVVGLAGNAGWTPVRDPLLGA